MKMKYRCKYEYANNSIRGEVHTWTVIGPLGGLHLHIHKYKDNEYTGGLEIHRRQPSQYQQDDAPSQDQCWLLHCPCWHDGSSLIASEKYIPAWRLDPHDHDGMFAMLCNDADYHFAPSDSN